MEGHDVTVVDMLPVDAFAKDASPSPRTMLMALLKKYNVRLIGESKVLRFTDKGVEIEDRNWNRTLLEADTAVNALGMKSDSDVVAKFAGLIPEVYVVGDAAQVNNIRHANQSAFIYAVEC